MRCSRADRPDAVVHVAGQYLARVGGRSRRMRALRRRRRLRFRRREQPYGCCLREPLSAYQCMKRSGSSVGFQTALPCDKQACCADALLGAQDFLEAASVNAAPQLVRMQLSRSTETGSRRACSRVRS